MQILVPSFQFHIQCKKSDNNNNNDGKRIPHAYVICHLETDII